MEAIKAIEKEQLRSDLPEFNIGDTIKVWIKIVEGDRERSQPFTGTVIARKGGGTSESITLRRVVYGEGVERVIPLHSPRLDKIEVVREGHVRRAKLYHLREKIGKAARVKAKRRAS
ncbi:MAG: 50S ribosomal protein L19 [Verrucomicrobia bacterium]|nr:50S ribosomal protein L19 [Verrucomicrobiota bacterium]